MPAPLEGSKPAIVRMTGTEAQEMELPELFTACELPLLRKWNYVAIIKSLP